MNIFQKYEKQHGYPSRIGAHTILDIESNEAIREAAAYAIGFGITTPFGWWFGMKRLTLCGTLTFL
jgi:hypothetical protein